jgi:Zn-dependent protease with chaperone function
MTPVALVYPPSPVDISPNLTAPSRRYRSQVIVVLASLFLFLVLYLAMIAGAVCFFYEALFFPIFFWKGLALLGSGLLLFFLLRGLLRRSQPDSDLLVEIRETDEPALFAFLHRLCDELKAPFPHRVYLSPDVNAAVFARTSILRLILPTRRNLLIGLGLVNALNLTEFKAVLAHEFGHFSQKSSRLTHYVYAANPVMADIVYRRDWLDQQVNRGWNVLLRAIAVDVRVGALLAAVFMPAIVPLFGLVLFRLLLESLYKGINFQNLSLLRQMEFNADLVAESVTGSDAPVHAFVRLQFAEEALAFTRDDLAGAADHGLYTRDLFYHQSRASEYLRQHLKDPQRGEPPPVPEDPNSPSQVFRPDNKDVLAMWATHPSHYDREQNLKRNYIRSSFDTRSPWVLFQEPEIVRTRVTERFYRAHFEVPADFHLTDPQDVQAVIEGERTEATYDPRYLGVYDDRFIELGDLSALTAFADRETWDKAQLTEAHAALFDRELAQWLEEHRHRKSEEQTLAAISPDTAFEFRGQKYPAGDARRMCSQVRRELDKDDLRWAELDRRVFLAHYHASRSLKQEITRELVERYRFHLAVQQILKPLGSQHDWLRSAVYYLSNVSQVTEDEYQALVKGAQDSQKVLSQCLNSANSLVLPELKHVTAGQSLGEFLRRQKQITDFRLEEKALLPKRLFGTLLTSERQLGEMRERVRRVHFKSLGGILALQESISAAAMAAGAVHASLDAPPATA